MGSRQPAGRVDRPPSGTRSAGRQDGSDNRVGSDGGGSGDGTAGSPAFA
jgi:hypothetical protein